MIRLLAILIVFALAGPAAAQLERNVASQKLIVFAWDKATGTPETAATLTTLTAKVSKDGAALAGTDDENPVELEGGYYAFDLLPAETDAIHLLFVPASSDADVGVAVANRANGTTIPAGLSTVAVADAAVASNTTRHAGTAVPAPDIAGYAKVTVAEGTGTGRLLLDGGNVSLRDSHRQELARASGLLSAGTIVEGGSGVVEINSIGDSKLIGQTLILFKAGSPIRTSTHRITNLTLGDPDVVAYDGTPAFTPATGDTYVVIANPTTAGGGGGDATEAKQDTILARLGGWTGSGTNNLLGGIQAMMRSDVTPPSDIGGTFAASTDSLQAIRDRGDAAWTSDGTDVNLVSVNGSAGAATDVAAMGVDYEAGTLVTGVATGVRTELAVELAHIDADISSRSDFDAATDGVTSAGTVTTLQALQDNLAAMSPTLGDIADEVRTELAVELARVDATVSSRASQATADAVETDTQNIQSRLPAALVDGKMDANATATLSPEDIAAIAAAVEVDNAAIAAAVRTNLATELGRIDVATSTRLATAGYTAPLDAAGTRAALGMASANLDTQLDSLEVDVDLSGVEASLTNISGRIPAALVDGKMDAVAPLELDQEAIDAIAESITLPAVYGRSFVRHQELLVDALLGTTTGADGVPGGTETVNKVDSSGVSFRVSTDRFGNRQSVVVEE